MEQFVRNLNGCLLGGSADVYQGVAEGRFVVGLTFEEGAARYVADGEPVRLVYMKEGVISTPDEGRRHFHSGCGLYREGEQAPGRS